MLLDCNEMVPDRLWVGCYVRPEHVRYLKPMAITTVVSLQSDEDLSHYNISEKKLLNAYQEAGIELRRAATPDFDKTALAANLPRCVDELEAALEPRWARVYLHCSAGVNRSPTVAAAYLIRARGLEPQAASDYVVSRRHCSPYLDLLEQYAASLKNGA